MSVEPRHELCALIGKEFRRLDVLRANLQSSGTRLADHQIAALVLRQAVKCRPVAQGAIAVGTVAAAVPGHVQTVRPDPAAKRHKTTVPEPSISSVQELQEMLQESAELSSTSSLLVAAS
mmetsp:Transcript_35220/g.78928  ORF Transcript_35220/g.78928 Transcript_35220/m.78928 type:complete len:120 (-) Transcript_35220:1147-1506(-)